MATPLTGSAGWTGLHPFQLGGPPLIHDWTRPIPDHATALLAHVYEVDGCTSKGTLKLLDRPVIQATNANGGLAQVVLNVSTRLTTAVYGQTNYGQGDYGGRVQQGNVIRLTEIDSPYKGFVYGGIVESLP